jgi:hypothetical protein
VIALATDCILLRQPNGESQPYNPGTVSIEVVTEGETPFDEAFVKEASAAVLHFFKNEQGRESVTLSEFAEALERVLKGFQVAAGPKLETPLGAGISEADLQQLAAESGETFELTFFPRLRCELRNHLRHSPRVMRFRGLRNCVLHLTGARRWNPRCRSLQEQIVNFLRECLNVEPHPESCALVVE